MFNYVGKLLSLLKSLTPTKSPMQYYRYRPYSELSLKELMYNEIFFASPEECNDPFDSKTFYRFSADLKKWAKLIAFSAGEYRLPLDGDLLMRLTEFICARCPITFEHALADDLFGDFVANNSTEQVLIGQLSKALQAILKVYKPASRYFVSLSRTASEPLMWSHYADRHQGFCLIFKAINCELLLSPNYRKDQIRRTTPGGIAQNMSFGLPEKFQFVDIDYTPTVEFLNAFLHLPVAVSGDAKNEDERGKILKLQQSHYAQKGQSWHYENESRLILAPPQAWLFGEHIEYTKQERLFHYEPAQLVGIIYGARMMESERNRVREILKERKEWDNRTCGYKRIVFRFVEFEALLSANQRNVEVKPLALLSYERIPVNHKDFDRLYAEWQEGVGFERDGTSSTRIVIK